MENLCNFFIVGAAKCGTTSLYEYLSQHSDIFMCPVKEPHFFTSLVENNNKNLYKIPEKGKKYHTRIVRDPAVYKNLFNEGSGYKIRGEASPSYLWAIDAPQRIFEYNPQAKIIILLRDPVKRLISNYQMDYAMGIQKSTQFLETVKEEFKKEKKIWGTDRVYIDLGFYYQQISRYAALFPSPQLLILKFDELIASPKPTLQRVFTFLGTDEKFADNIIIEQHNTASRPISPWINTIRKNKIVKVFSSLLGKEKDALKTLLYKKGYTNKLAIDEESQRYLYEIYKEDLRLLKEEYKITFDSGY
jgi:hypothetical protein